MAVSSAVHPAHRSARVALDPPMLELVGDGAEASVTGANRDRLAGVGGGAMGEPASSDTARRRAPRRSMAQLFDDADRRRSGIADLPAAEAMELALHAQQEVWAARLPPAAGRCRWS